MTLKRTPVFSDNFNHSTVLNVDRPLIRMPWTEEKEDLYRIDSIDQDGGVVFQSSVYNAILMGYQRHHMLEMAREDAANTLINTADTSMARALGIQKEQDAMRWVHMLRTVAVLDRIEDHFKQDKTVDHNEKMAQMLTDIGVYQRPDKTAGFSAMDVVRYMQRFDEHVATCFQDSDAILDRIQQWSAQNDPKVGDILDDYRIQMREVKQHLHASFKDELKDFLGSLYVDTRKEMIDSFDRLDPIRDGIKSSIQFNIAPSLKEHMATRLVESRIPRNIEGVDVRDNSRYPLLSTYLTDPRTRDQSLWRELIDASKTKLETLKDSLKSASSIGKFFFSKAVVINSALRGGFIGGVLKVPFFALEVGKGIAGFSENKENLKDAFSVFRSNSENMVRRLHQFDKSLMTKEDEKLEDQRGVAEAFVRLNALSAQSVSEIDYWRSISTSRQALSDLAKTTLHTLKDELRPEIKWMGDKFDSAIYALNGGDFMRRSLGSMEASVGAKPLGLGLKASVLCAAYLLTPAAQDVVQNVFTFVSSGMDMDVLWNIAKTSTETFLNKAALDFDTVKMIANDEPSKAGFLSTANTAMQGAALAGLGFTSGLSQRLN